MTALVAVVAVVVVTGFAVLLSYNRFVSQQNFIRESWSDIDTELQRRYDLIPNLVATVKGYAAHEQAVLDAVTRARASAVASTGPPASQEADERALVGSLKQLLAVAEGYPQLKASDQFLELQRQLATTEDRIQVARRVYNGNVRDYNRRVESVPSSIIAGLAHLTKAEYFEVDPAVGASPKVA